MWEEHTICSPSDEYRRKVWYLPSLSARPQKIGLFLDGEFYVERIDAPAIIRALEASGQVPPMACIFVSHIDGAARHADFTCNPQYTEFLVTDVLSWVREQYSSLPASGHLIGGISLSGLAAAYAALTHTNVFTKCLAHSGSFWWNQEWLLSFLSEANSSPLKWWLSVGSLETEAGVSHPPSGMRQEVAQISACERFGEALTNRGHEVHYNPYDGGHEMAPWKAELPAALSWLCKA